MRWSIADGALATVMGTLTSGVFLTGMALALGASRLQIGVLAALPPLATVMQLVGSYLIERHGQRKRLCFWASLLSRCTWVPLLLVAMLPRGEESRRAVWAIAALIGLGSALGSIGGVAWLSWTKELVPDRLRIRFLSRRNFMTTLLSLSLGMLVGVVLDGWNAAFPSSMGGFALLLGFALLAGVCSSYCMSKVSDAKPPAQCEPADFGELVSLPFRDVNFRRVLLFYGLWNLSVHVAGPFFSVYMLQTMGLPFLYVTGLITLSSIVGLCFNGFWARLKERYGIKPVIYLATLADAFVPLLWVFASGTGYWLLIVIHFFGVFSAPLALGPNTMVMRLAPSVRSSAYMAVFSALIGPVTALASIAGGAVSGAFEGSAAGSGWIQLGGLQFIFLLSFVGRLLSLLVLKRIEEPAALPARDALAHIVSSAAQLTRVLEPRELRRAAGLKVFSISLRDHRQSELSPQETSLPIVGK
jgi:MFS family permease